MNKVYKTIWSWARHAFVVSDEHHRSHVKSSGSVKTAAAVGAAVLLSAPAMAYVQPADTDFDGPHIVFPDPNGSHAYVDDGEYYFEGATVDRESGEDSGAASAILNNAKLASIRGVSGLENFGKILDSNQGNEPDTFITGVSFEMGASTGPNGNIGNPGTYVWTNADFKGAQNTASWADAYGAEQSVGTLVLTGDTTAIEGSVTVSGPENPGVDHVNRAVGFELLNDDGNTTAATSFEAKTTTITAANTGLTESDDVGAVALSQLATSTHNDSMTFSGENASIQASSDHSGAVGVWLQKEHDSASGNIKTTFANAKELKVTAQGRHASGAVVEYGEVVFDTPTATVTATATATAGGGGDATGIRIDRIGKVSLNSGTLTVNATSSQVQNGVFGDGDIGAVALAFDSAAAKFETTQGTKLSLNAESKGAGVGAADAISLLYDNYESAPLTLNAALTVTATAKGGYAAAADLAAGLVLNADSNLTATSQTNTAFGMVAGTSEHDYTVSFAAGEHSLTASSNAVLGNSSGINPSLLPLGAGAIALAVNTPWDEGLKAGAVTVETASGTSLTLNASTDSASDDAAAAVALYVNENSTFRAEGSFEATATAKSKGEAFGVLVKGGSVVFDAGNEGTVKVSAKGSGDSVGVHFEGGELAFNDGVSITALSSAGCATGFDGTQGGEYSASGDSVSITAQGYSEAVGVRSGADGDILASQAVAIEATSESSHATGVTFHGVYGLDTNAPKGTETNIDAPEIQINASVTGQDATGTAAGIQTGQSTPYPVLSIGTKQAGSIAITATAAGQASARGIDFGPNNGGTLNLGTAGSEITIQAIAERNTGARGIRFEDSSGILNVEAETLTVLAETTTVDDDLNTGVDAIRIGGGATATFDATVNAIAKANGFHSGATGIRIRPVNVTKENTQVVAPSASVVEFKRDVTASGSDKTGMGRGMALWNAEITDGSVSDGLAKAVFKGNLRATGEGRNATGVDVDNDAYRNGDAIGRGPTVGAGNGTTLVVEGNLSASAVADGGSAYGVHANQADIQVGGLVIDAQSKDEAGDAYGIYADNGSELSVSGDLAISVQSEHDAFGLYPFHASEYEITGDVAVIESLGKTSALALESNWGSQGTISSNSRISITAEAEGIARGIRSNGYSSEKGSKLVLDAPKIEISAKVTGTDADTSADGIFSYTNDRDIHSLSVGTQQAGEISVRASSAGQAKARAVRVHGGTVNLGREGSSITLQANSSDGMAQSVNASGSSAVLNVTADKLVVISSAENFRADGLRFAGDAQATFNAEVEVQASGNKDGRGVDGIRTSLINSEDATVTGAAAESVVFNENVSVSSQNASGTARGVTVWNGAVTDTSVQTQGKAGVKFVKDLSIIATAGKHARGIDVDNDAYVNADQNYRGLVVGRGNGANLSVGGALTVEATAGEVRAIGVNVNDASVTVAGAADITATATGNEAEAIGVQVVSGTLDFAGDAKISATGGASSLAASVGDGGVVNFGGSSTVLTGRVDVLQNGTINVNAGNATMESFTIAEGGRVNVAANAKLTTLTGQIFSAALNEAGGNTGEGMQKLYSDDSLALAAGSHLAFNDAKYNSSYAYAAGALYSGVTLVFNGNRVDTNRVLYETLPESSDTVESNVDVVVSASQQGTATLTKTFGVSSVIASNEALNKVEIGGKTTLVGDSSGTKELVSFAGSGDKQVKVSSTGTLQLGQDGSSANKGVISAGIQTLGKLIVSAGEYVLDALELGNDGSLKVDNGSTLSISASSDGDVDALRLNDASTVNLVSGTLNLTAETSQSADQYGDDEITAKALNHHSSSATFETAAGTSLVLKATSTGTGIASADAEAAHIEGVTTFGGTVNATASAVGGYAQGMVTHGDVVFNDKVWLTASSDTNAAIALGAEESRGTSNSAKITFNGDATLTASSNAGVSTLPEDAGADGAAYGLDISPSDNLGQGQVDGQVVTAAGTTLTIRASTNSQAQDAGSAIGLTGSGNAQLTAAGAVDIGATANGKGDAFGVRWNGGTAAFNGDAAITATSASGEAVGVKAEAGTVKFAGDTTTITAANALLVSGGTVEFAGKTAQVKGLADVRSGGTVNLTAGDTTMESFTIAEGGKINVASGATLTTLTGQVFTIALNEDGKNSGAGMAKRYGDTALALAANSTLALNDAKYNSLYVKSAQALCSGVTLVFNGDLVDFEGGVVDYGVLDATSETVLSNVDVLVNSTDSPVSIDKTFGVSSISMGAKDISAAIINGSVTLVGDASGSKELISFAHEGANKVTVANGAKLTLGQEKSTANHGKLSTDLTVAGAMDVNAGAFDLSYLVVDGGTVTTKQGTELKTANVVVTNNGKFMAEGAVASAVDFDEDSVIALAVDDSVVKFNAGADIQTTNTRGSATSVAVKGGSVSFGTGSKIQAKGQNGSTAILAGEKGTIEFGGNAEISATSASGKAVGVDASLGTVRFAGDSATITAANALRVSGGTVEFAGKTAQVKGLADVRSGGTVNLTAGNTTMESFTIAEGGKINVASGAMLTTLTGQVFTVGLDSEGTNSGEGLAKRYDETRLGLASNSTLAFNDPKYNAVYMANASELYSGAKLVFNGTRVEFAEGETANVNVEDLPSGTDVVETNVNAEISGKPGQQTVSLGKSVGVSAVVVNGESVTKLEVTQQVTLVGSADGDKELIQFSGSGEKQVTLTAAGSSLTLGQEGSTANAGKISVALTVQNQTSLTVKEGSYTLSDVTASTGGKIEVSNGNVAVDKLTLDGGNLTAENGQLTAQTMTLGKSSVISLGDAITQIATLVIDAIQDAVHTITGEMKTDSLQVKEGASSFIRIGTSTAQGDQENKAGRLEIAKNFIMKGLTFFLDPVYQNGTIADASKLSVASTSIDGKIAVGENSYAVLGSQGADADQKMIDDSGIAWDGTTNSALFVAQPVTITSTGGILVDKTATATSSIADGSVTFAANSVLVANASAAETAAITAHSFSIADNAKAILVGDLDESKTYTLLAKEDGSALGDGEFFKNVTPANAMWELDGTGSGSGQYKFVIVDAGKVYGDLMQGTEIATSAMRGKGTAAEKRYANSLLEQVEGESRADAASRFDAAMNPAQALTTFTTAYDRAAETRKFVREEAEKAQDNRLWVHVTGGKTKLKGVGTGSSQKLHTKTSSYGIVVGGQAAVNDSLTLGAAFSAGAGSTKNNSVSGKDKFDYYGLSVYGATSLGAVDLKADASVMLLKSDISIGGAADVKSDVKTYVYSLGLEAGRTFDLGAVDVTPFIGADVYHVRGHGFNNGHGASVKKSDATAVEFPIGARIGKAFETQGGFSVAPAFSLAVVPTVADRKVDSKVCFAGAESTYRYTFTDDVKVRTSLGLDVKKGNFSAGLHAGYEWGNEERSSTSVQLRAKYMF